MEAMNYDSSNKLHIVMFPWFAYGHINPFIQLSNKFSSHGIKISFLSIPGNVSRIQSSLKFTPPDQEVIPLTIPQVEGLSPEVDTSKDSTPKVLELLKKALHQMQPQVKTLLTQLKPQIVLFELSHPWLPSIASELGIKTVHFCVFSAVANSYFHRSFDPKIPLATIDDLKKPPSGFPKTSITDLKTFQARNIHNMLKSIFDGPPAKERDASVVMGYEYDAIVYKTCSEIEGPYVEYLRNQLGKPLLLGGPAVPLPPSGALDAKWEGWLSQFPEKSVIFCNFGSETYLSDGQIKELTLGLEHCGQPFFLVLNLGNSVEVQAKLDASLPEGFRERVGSRGVVHTGWVQQQHILAHKSVGCYLNHSGFSSVMEGIVSDCQLILLPQKGDQFLNSKLVSGDLKVGLEVNRRDEDGYFGSEDILEAIKIVMVDTDKEPGKSIRSEQRKWKEFLLKKEVEDKYIVNLVKELKALRIVES